ncbi:MAG TPA: MaoC family dehydratase [Xanthobacteraceae bacterium]|nr:MaoC family dehydratase [Xanthobacteraceae bacterium]
MRPSRDLFLEDFAVGQRFETEGIAVTEADIIAFARQFDPQYFHLDPVAAATSAFGGLVASGLHTLSLAMRVFFELNLWERAIIGSPGLEHVRWLIPLRPGDTIRSMVEISAVKRSRSKPDRGVVSTAHRTFNQHHQVIFTMTCLHIVRARGAG